MREWRRLWPWLILLLSCGGYLYWRSQQFPEDSWLRAPRKRLLSVWSEPQRWRWGDSYGRYPQYIPLSTGGYFHIDVWNEYFFGPDGADHTAASTNLNDWFQTAVPSTGGGVYILRDSGVELWTDTGQMLWHTNYPQIPDGAEATEALGIPDPAGGLRVLYGSYCWRLDPAGMIQAIAPPDCWRKGALLDTQMRNGEIVLLVATANDLSLQYWDGRRIWMRPDTHTTQGRLSPELWALLLNVNQLTLIDAKGKQVWQRSVKDRSYRFQDSDIFNSIPIASDGTVALRDGSELHFLDTQGKDLRPAIELGEDCPYDWHYSGLTLVQGGDGTVYLQPQLDTIVAFDPHGRLLWRNTGWRRRMFMLAAGSDGSIYARLPGRTLSAIPPGSGEQECRFVRLKPAP